MWARLDSSNKKAENLSGVQVPSLGQEEMIESICYTLFIFLLGFVVGAIVMDRIKK